MHGEIAKLVKMKKQGETRMPWDNVRLTKVEKREETKMIQCLVVALYHSRESKTWKMLFTEGLYLALSVHLSRLDLFLHFSILFISSKKRKRKETDYISMNQRCYPLVAVYNVNNVHHLKDLNMYELICSKSLKNKVTYKLFVFKSSICINSIWHEII